MSFEIAKKKSEFWHAYWENKDERFIFNDKTLTPQEFFEVWLHKNEVHTYEDIPTTRSNEK